MFPLEGDTFESGSGKEASKFLSDFKEFSSTQHIIEKLHRLKKLRPLEPWPSSTE